jgi:hypothetical protein
MSARLGSGEKRALGIEYRQRVKVHFGAAVLLLPVRASSRALRVARRVAARHRSLGGTGIVV